MNDSHYSFTHETNFFGQADPHGLAAEYGSPLYVYNEQILRERCREMAGLVKRPGFRVHYSAKANTNLALLRIVRNEGLGADAVSAGEIFMLLKAGFKPEEILLVCNNVSAEEISYAAKQGVTVSVDSLSQLDMFGRIRPGGRVAVRINPGVGAGHHKKVVTAGSETKFGVQLADLAEIHKIAARHNLTVAGLNQHIGSLFLKPDAFLAASQRLLEGAEEFENLEFIDFGGGFGIPYRRQDKQSRLDLEDLSQTLTGLIDGWTAKTGYQGAFIIEPGRYLAAECGVLLGTVRAVKNNGEKKFVGTDLGFNVLSRPVLYGSHHELELYPKSGTGRGPAEIVSVVGNICESGDILAKDRLLPPAVEGDLIGVLDAGAYGFAMSSNYNQRLRPAEVLIRTDGRAALIRRRETMDDLLSSYYQDGQDLALSGAA